MLHRLRRRAWGLSGRLIASYILVTLFVVVLVEALALGFQVPLLAHGVQVQAQWQARVDATAESYGRQLAQRYPAGVPVGTGLGDPGLPADPGRAVAASDGRTLAVPAIPALPEASGSVDGGQAVTAVVVIGADGTIVASSAPAQYRPGRAAAGELPAPAAQAIVSGRIKPGDMGTPHGSVLWTVWSDKSDFGAPSVYVQAPWPAPRFINPVRAWSELGQVGETSGLLLLGPFALVVVTVPVGVLFGLLATRRLVGRVRRLEQATLAVADGDYNVVLQASGRDEIGRLEENFTTMARQLGSALAAERRRAGGDARDAERARIAREIHDAISQHLFGLRMIAAGMRRADPEDQQARTIERIAEEALRDMQALLAELRPASPGAEDAASPVSPDRPGLASALRELCAAYRQRLGVDVEARLEDVVVPAPVEHALLRIAQEACVNAVRHGNADHLTVSLARLAGDVELAVRDSGSGFDPDGAAAGSGSGLAHIRGRAGEVGGSVVVDSALGRGTVLTVRVPVS